MWVVGILLFVTVFGDFLANEKPLYCRIEGRNYFPVFREIGVSLGIAGWPEPLRNADWHAEDYDRVLWPLVPYSPGTLDLANAGFQAPFAPNTVRSTHFRHWLGTDALGRDVLAGLIGGTRISLLVGVLSMLIAGMIGAPLGAFSGYFGDNRHAVCIHTMLIWVVALICFAYYMIYGVSQVQEYPLGGIANMAMGVLAVGVACLCDFLSGRLGIRTRRISLPWDFIIMRSIEVLRSFPAFFLLFAILGLIRAPSLIYVVLLIAVLRSPAIIRYVRAEAMKLRDQAFVDAARTIGLTDRSIIFRHIIPNSLGPVFITLAFGVGVAVLLESGLSFLGIGVALDQVTWGKMLSVARNNFSAWWMAVFPGLAIFLTIAVFNRIGDVLTGIFQPQ